jgi:cobyrinic acid a,c-diamide synthase
VSAATSLDSGPSAGEEARAGLDVHTSCQALFVAAPGSGQGKTTVTAGLARLYRRQGLRVRVFKTGPDFLDPMILEQASGRPVYQLDLWMGGADHCRALMHEATAESDRLLVEGVMGLYDGVPSSADLAILLGIPVLAVIDASAMAQTFAAIAHGLASFRPGLPFAGVLANRVSSPAHASMLEESLSTDLSWAGALLREEAVALPHRHLGLVQAQEIADLEARLERAASALSRTRVDSLARPLAFPPADQTPPVPLLAGTRIAVARDAAFAFTYRANLDLLRALGAELRFFSPLRDEDLPAADSLYLPGGYPELHMERLAANTGMREAIRDHHRAGRPILAECGGMLYLLEALTDKFGARASMVGLLPGEAVMHGRLANLGLHRLELPDGGEVRGHTFHHSRLSTSLTPAVMSRPVRQDGRPEPLFRDGRLYASYLHLYFPSNPGACARLFSP